MRSVGHLSAVAALAALAASGARLERIEEPAPTSSNTMSPPPPQGAAKPKPRGLSDSEQAALDRARAKRARRRFSGFLQKTHED